MNRIKSKRRAFILLTVFTALLLTGSVLAFGEGRLTFAGTVNVHSTLALEVHNFRVVDFYNLGGFLATIPDEWEYFTSQSVPGGEGNIIEFSAMFFEPATVYYEFNVVNVGSMDAVVELISHPDRPRLNIIDYNLLLLGFGVRYDIEIINNDRDYAVVANGDYVTFRVKVELYDIDQYDQFLDDFSQPGPRTARTIEDFNDFDEYDWLAFFEEWQDIDEWYWYQVEALERLDSRFLGNTIATLKFELVYNVYWPN